MTQNTTNNEHFDLISVLYHALQATQTYDTYIKDAQQAGDQELVQFLQQVKQEDLARAEKAKQLLASRSAKLAGR